VHAIKALYTSNEQADYRSWERLHKASATKSQVLWDRRDYYRVCARNRLEFAIDLTATGFVEITSFKYSANIVCEDSAGKRRLLAIGNDTPIKNGLGLFTIDQQ
jgi:hypothetical protein